MKTLIIAAALALPLSVVQAGKLFDIQVSLMTEKAELCIRSGNRDSKFCQDFDGYREYIFKGQTEVWLSYHVHNGDITGRNIKAVDHMMDKALEAMQQ